MQPHARKPKQGNEAKRPHLKKNNAPTRWACGRVWLHFNLSAYEYVASFDLFASNASAPCSGILYMLAEQTMTQNGNAATRTTAKRQICTTRSHLKKDNVSTRWTRVRVAACPFLGRACCCISVCRSKPLDLRFSAIHLHSAYHVDKLSCNRAPACSKNGSAS